MAISYTEEDLRKACAEAQRTRRLRSVARRWAIPPTTLYRRLNGALPRSVAHEDQQRLSITQESHLANWIRIQQAAG
ncbi:hypothetical protein B0T24DRAFT_621773, partial [Lasiosphaeria ovina]